MLNNITSLPSLITVSLLASFGCASDNEISVQRQELRTDEDTYNIEVVAVGERKTIPVTLQSVGPGSVTIYSITSSDPDHFVVLPSWAQTDSDGDGVADQLKLQRGSESEPTQEIVEINFRPDADGLFRGQLTILSDDSTTKERTEDDKAIMRVAVRGIGRVPCAEVFPEQVDFGKKPAGGYFSETLTLRNCGEAPLTISSFQVDGSSSFYGASATPIYIFEGETKTAEVAWIPSSNNPEYGDMGITINDPNFPAGIPLMGNDCENSKHEDWDVDGDGWRACLGDCDDNDASVNPSAYEVQNNKDDNCDGIKDEEFDETVDFDFDGFAPIDGDCFEGDPNINPGVEEVLNGYDDDCDGIIDNNTDGFDDDEDGLTELEGDCDDADSAVHPESEEVENGYDDNCNGFVDEGSETFDDDRDGYSEADGDCDDGDPWAWPSNIEDCDGVDNDCDGLVDEGDDDSENGACAFVAEREAPQTLETPQGGCQNASLSSRQSLAWVVLSGLLGLTIRRRS